MKKIDLLVIGGGPAGLISAVTAKKSDPEKKVVLVRPQKQGVIPCGIPYVFNRLESVDQDILPDKSLVDNGVEIVIDEIESVNFDKREAKSKKGTIFVFEKTILALGSKPVIPPIKGAESPNIWYVQKDLDYLKKMKLAAKKAKNIAIVGGGYIGVEIAEELSSFDEKKITIIERLENCLGTTMDKEFSINVKNSLESLGVKLRLGTNVEKIETSGEKSILFLDKGDSLNVDMLIMTTGARANGDLLSDGTIKKNKDGSIKVNEFMETSMENVFAVGDCAEKKCLITGEQLSSLLASTACYEARVAGKSVFNKNERIKNKGTLASFSTMIDGTAYAVTGLIESFLKKKKINGLDETEIISGSFECACHHPGALPNTKAITVKLTFRKSDKCLIGAQLMGPEKVGEMINSLALGIQKKATAYDLASMQVATHPLLTPAPTIYPLIVAAQKVL